MGRVNAMPQVGVVAARGVRSGPLDWRATAVPETRRRRLSLVALGAILWFAVSTGVELYNGGPDVDGPLFIATVLVTCLIGGSLGRSVADDVALAAGSILGLVVSGVLVAIEPQGHSMGDLATLSFYLGLAVVLISPAVRRAVGSLRSA